MLFNFKNIFSKKENHENTTNPSTNDDTAPSDNSICSMNTLLNVIFILLLVYLFYLFFKDSFKSSKASDNSSVLVLLSESNPSNPNISGYDNSLGGLNPTSI